MSVAAAIANPILTQRRVAMLDQWAAAGMALARSLASESGRGLIDAARVFARIAQAVRLAIFLALRLRDPTNPAYQPTPAKPRAARASGPETLAEAGPVQSEHVENEPLETEPAERPERQDRTDSGDREISDDAILRRPLAEIVKLICRALGVTPDLSLWTDEVDTPERPAPCPCPGSASAPSPPPDPGRTIPSPPPRPSLIIDRPEPPPPDRGLRARLLGSCAPGALCPVISPIVVPTIGGARASKD
jgi:hypothetical protein